LTPTDWPRGFIKRWRRSSRQAGSSGRRKSDLRARHVNFDLKGAPRPIFFASRKLKSVHFPAFQREWRPPLHIYSYPFFARFMTTETTQTTTQPVQLVRALKLRDLILFNLVAVLGLRHLGTAAIAGPATLTLWVIAAIFFFVPQGLAVIELSSRFPASGG